MDHAVLECQRTGERRACCFSFPVAPPLCRHIGHEKETAERNSCSSRPTNSKPTSQANLFCVCANANVAMTSVCKMLTYVALNWSVLAISVLWFNEKAAVCGIQTKRTKDSSKLCESHGGIDTLGRAIYAFEEDLNLNSWCLHHSSVPVDLECSETKFSSL